MSPTSYQTAPPRNFTVADSPRSVNLSSPNLRCASMCTGGTVLPLVLSEPLSCLRALTLGPKTVLDGRVSEQRKSRRFQLNLPVELVRAGMRKISHVAETRNLSSRGILFVAKELKLEIGLPIEYLIQLPTASGVGVVRLRCVGKVVRREERYDATAATLERYEFVRSD
jgi:hypothetical protein